MKANVYKEIIVKLFLGKHNKSFGYFSFKQLNMYIFLLTMFFISGPGCFGPFLSEKKTIRKNDKNSFNKISNASHLHYKNFDYVFLR